MPPPSAAAILTTWPEVAARVAGYLRLRHLFQFRACLRAVVASSARWRGRELVWARARARLDGVNLPRALGSSISGRHIRTMSLASASSRDLRGDVRDCWLAAVADHCPLLERLDLTNQREITDVGLRNVARCTRLRSLVLAGCWECTDSGLCQVVASCGLLAHLDVSNCFTVAGDFSFGPDEQRSSQLASLRFIRCPLLTDGALLSVAASCHRTLAALDVSLCRGVTDAGVMAVAAACPGLRSPQLLGCRLVSGRCLSDLRARHPALVVS